MIQLGYGRLPLAIEQLQFAPVITPRTLEELARILRRDENYDLADVVSELVPVASEIVQNFFVPMSQLSDARDFAVAFENLSHGFEPYRLYVNIKLLQSLRGPDFFRYYGNVLLRLNEELVRSAEAKQIPGQRLREIITSYFDMFVRLVQSMTSVERIGMPRHVEELNLADWVRSSTELDYGLTGLFLMLENAISTPPAPIPQLLLAATAASLDSFAGQYRIFTDSVLGGSIQSDLLAEMRFARSQELEWLRNHSDTLPSLAGKWIVLEGEHLIAEDPSYENARKTAKKAGIGRPFIIFVPEATETAFMGL